VRTPISTQQSQWEKVTFLVSWQRNVCAEYCGQMATYALMKLKKFAAILQSRVNNRIFVPKTD
jgi:hypothetical protein